MSVMWSRRSGNSIIKAIRLPYPSYTGFLFYTGSSISPSWTNYDGSKIDISGDISAIECGVYTTVFTPKEGYCWSDNVATPYSVTWSIYKEKLTVPSPAGTLTYNGVSQTPTWKNYDSSKITIGGVTSSTNAGTYEAIFTLKSGYIWADETTATKKVSWVIGKSTPIFVAEPSSVTLSLSTDAAGVEVIVTCTNIKLSSCTVGYPSAIFTAHRDQTIALGKWVYKLIPVGVGSGSAHVVVNSNDNHTSGSLNIPVTVTA